jgi:hypothetical protein
MNLIHTTLNYSKIQVDHKWNSSLAQFIIYYLLFRSFQ